MITIIVNKNGENTNISKNDKKDNDNIIIIIKY